MATQGARVAFSTAVVGFMAWPLQAWAQGPGAVQDPGSAPTGTAVAVGGFLMIVGVIVFFGGLVKLLDFRRKRETEAVILQAGISDAVLRDPSLSGLPITPSARVPFWKGSPVTVEVAGQVPSEDMLRATLRTVEDEARRFRRDVRIESRVSVVPSMASRFGRRVA